MFQCLCIPFFSMTFNVIVSLFVFETMQGHSYSTAPSANWLFDISFGRRKIEPQDEPRER